MSEAQVALAMTALASAPLIYAAATKIMGPETFAAALPSLRLGMRGSATTAYATGTLEAAIATGLIFAQTWLTAAVAALLYSIFAVILLRAVLMGSRGDCGCFGSMPSRIDGRAVARNVAFALAALGIGLGRAMGSLATYEVGHATAVALGLFIASAVIDTVVVVRVSSGR